MLLLPVTTCISIGLMWDVVVKVVVVVGIGIAIVFRPHSSAGRPKGMFQDISELTPKK